MEEWQPFPKTRAAIRVVTSTVLGFGFCLIAFMFGTLTVYNVQAMLSAVGVQALIQTVWALLCATFCLYLCYFVGEWWRRWWKES